MKVKNLMEQFQDFKVLAGAGGLDRNVSTVSVMDAPDIYNWMKGGEFLITTGYIMRDNPLELRDLVIKLNEHGAASLGIKVGRFIEELPKEVKEVGDGLNFPIIYIPKWYAFTDIINPVLSSIVNSQAKKLMMSENIHKSFTQMVIQGKSTSDIMDTLYKILDKDIAFIDLIFNRNYIRGNSHEFKEDIYNMGLKDNLDKYYNYPVQIGSSIYGYIVVEKNGKDILSDLDNISIEHASTVLKLNIQKEISNHQIEQKYRDEFIQDLILNNIKTVEEANNRAALYGWKIENGLICLIVDIDNFKEKFISLKNTQELEEEKNKIFRLANGKMKRNFKQCFYTVYSDNIVFLVEPNKKSIDDFIKNLKNVAEELRKEIKENSSFTVSIGIGTYQESIIDVYISFVEAQKAVRIGRTVYERDNTHIYSDLGVYKMLYNLSLEDDANKFCGKYLQNLIDYDIENNSEYIKTLRSIVKNDWNLKQTSEEMFIHYNTIKYRFSKICEIVNLDLNSREGKFKIEFCLKLMDMSNQYSLYMKTKV
ncbi:PucR family transcriptional regulator ligand-binding domain-containing protein [Tissierella carlieri]|uniref:PucR family transcriptional regulator n=1 Tax=Tissierella carlieri TaxID=689904 RepID=UPI001C0FAAA4|nr:PucR family transcriptional regulator [Tissierella carlieri]MBU5311274.1 PucR family transcriptional regulator ligand-binding domain-containing protein [Tissierella carlieri]